MGNKPIIYEEAISYFENVLSKFLIGIIENLYVSEGYGGVFFALCQYIIISECNFINNTNKFAGVGYLSPLSKDDASDILIERNIFMSNKAGDNSGVFLFSSDYIKVNCLIKDNIFINNVGKSIYLFF